MQLPHLSNSKREAITLPRKHPRKQPHHRQKSPQSPGRQPILHRPHPLRRYPQGREVPDLRPLRRPERPNRLLDLPLRPPVNIVRRSAIAHTTRPQTITPHPSTPPAPHNGGRHAPTPDTPARCYPARSSHRSAVFATSRCKNHPSTLTLSNTATGVNDPETIYCAV